MRVVDGWWWNIVEMLIKMVNEATKGECQQGGEAIAGRKIDENKR